MSKKGYPNTFDGKSKAIRGCYFRDNEGSCNTMTIQEHDYYMDHMNQYRDMYYAAIVLIVWGCLNAIGFLAFVFLIYWTDEKMD